MSQLVHAVNQTMPDTGSIAEYHEMARHRVVRVSGLVLLWRERARQRRVLASLDDRLLRDVGISQSAALRETGKPFWRR